MDSQLPAAKLVSDSSAVVSVGASEGASGSQPAPQPWTEELIRAIAMDIGKELVAYIEVMYPEAIKATSSTFKLSMRNHVYNQIMAAVKVNDAGQIEARLQERQRHRREWVGMYRKMRRKRS